MAFGAGSLIKQLSNSSRQYTRSSKWGLRPAPAAAARGFDDDDLVGAERQARLARYLADAAIAMQDGVAAGLAVGAAMQPVGGEAAALALQRYARLMVEAADRAHQTVAA